MQFKKQLYWILTIVVALTLGGCGGSSQPDDEFLAASGTSIGATPATGNYVYLQSDAGDYIGQGQTYTYTKANANISVTVNGGVLSVGVTGNQSWNGDFQAPVKQLKLGTYNKLSRYPSSKSTKGSLDWYGDGRGCNTLIGSFKIDSILYASGRLASIDMHFDQHCEGAVPALHGKIHWTSTDNTSPPGPVNPPPAGLWQPSEGATPTTGNYVYLQSDTGDYIGQGQTHTYTKANASIYVSASGGHLYVGVGGDQNWAGNFQTMSTLSQLQIGYYGGLQRYPFNNPVTGGLDWSGEGRGCNTLQGWFAIDSIAYVDGSISSIDLRFEQHCEGVAAALHGKIHWTPNDTTSPPGPVDPLPGTWQPSDGTTPATGNYVYLQSDTGDYIGQGHTYTYTKANASISITANGGHLGVSVQGDQTWSGDFQTMNTLSQLQTGYYGGLERYPFNNPAAGGLNWSGEGRGCNTLQGWFVVDNVTYVNGSLTSIDLRFEQHCEGGTTALHGKIHWSPNDNTSPPGPVDPLPGTWQPPADATPATGNYVYLQSDTGDYIGQGHTYTYTKANASISITANGGHLGVNIHGDQSWSGDFQTMNTLSQLQTGYYGGLERYPFSNPAAGGLNWSGEGRGCNTLQGWFAVDNVTYVNGSLTSIDLRFEQHCEGGTTALHGKIHWSSDDNTSPPGPIDPPPGTWQPPADTTPATGNYVYLQSDSGDYIGQGQTYLYTPENANIYMSASGGLLSTGISGSQNWSGNFRTMSSLSQLQVGYYGGLERYPFNNPVTGGLSWYGEGRGCNTLQGWFAVDNVTYTDGGLTSIDLRFEQHCEGGSPALHGKIHWVK